MSNSNVKLLLLYCFSTTYCPMALGEQFLCTCFFNCNMKHWRCYASKRLRIRMRKHHFEKHLPATTFNDITTQVHLFFISCYFFISIRFACWISKIRFKQDSKNQQSTNYIWNHESGPLAWYDFFLLNVYSSRIFLHHLLKSLLRLYFWSDIFLWDKGSYA